MKKALLSFVLLFAATAMSAQRTIVKGDMNGDNELTIADAVSVVDVILGKASKEEISLGGDPYAVDNTLVVGTWYAPDGTSFTLNADGTTTGYSGATTYKFRPQLGTLLFFDASGKPVKKIVVDEVEKGRYLLTVNSATDDYTYYTSSASLVSGLTMSESTLTLNSGTTAQLYVTVTPSDALNPSVSWTSNDEAVATVDASGLVTAVAGGSCTITATATDGSGQTATCQVTVVQLVTSITLSQTTLVLEPDGSQKLTAEVQPDNASNKNVTWSSSDESVAEVTRNGLVAAIGLGKCTITCTANDGSGISASCTVTVTNDHSGTINGRDYVDLGLPTGTLWATCNVGATSPESYGDYFAWGETVPYGQEDTNNAMNYAYAGTYKKTCYDWSTYKWCNGSYNTMTKYCTQSSYGYNGFTDNKTELDLEDDAAYVNWGPAWRMPSKAQYEELTNSNYTTTTWTTQNGVKGWLITSKREGYTDNSIFLPAAGGRDGGSLYDAGSYGDYWSRTLSESYPYGAWYLYFDSSDINASDCSRCSGQSVRPVRVRVSE